MCGCLSLVIFHRLRLRQSGSVPPCTGNCVATLVSMPTMCTEVGNRGQAAVSINTARPKAQCQCNWAQAHLLALVDMVVVSVNRLVPTLVLSIPVPPSSLLAFVGPVVNRATGHLSVIQEARIIFLEIVFRSLRPSWPPFRLLLLGWRVLV